MRGWQFMSNRQRSCSDTLRRGLTNDNPPGIGLWALWREDLRTHENDPFSQGFWAVAVHRYGNWRMGIRPALLRKPFSMLYRVLAMLVEWFCGIQLPYTIKLGRRVHLWHFGGIILSGQSIGDECHIRQNTTCGVARRGDTADNTPTIGNRVDIGAGAVIIGRVTIGDDSIIGANAVVLTDVPANSIAVGVPARIVAKFAKANVFVGDENADRGELIQA